jgi:hypothetical protein
MRKVKLLVAMLAMVLLLATPAFAQASSSVTQESNQFGVVDDSVCSQVYNIAVQQSTVGNRGDNTVLIGINTTNNCL